MAMYVYPAILSPEDGGYNVTFPDLPTCYTCGDDLAQALMMAEDALSLVLMDMEDEAQAIPAATTMPIAQEGELVTLIKADTVAYRKRVNNRAVKKTLSIPQWMNEAAEKQGVNFSQVLQDALRSILA